MPKPLVYISKLITNLAKNSSAIVETGTIIYRALVKNNWRSASSIYF